MYEYMKALRQRFFKEPACEDANREIEELHRHLAERLSRDDRKKLLKLEDLEIGLRDDISLASFVAGFKLAWGIAKEVSAEGVYSFADEEEQRACEALEKSKQKEANS
jgi:hypothetical protein